jgi:hypothetical protein
MVMSLEMIPVFTEVEPFCRSQEFDPCARRCFPGSAGLWSASHSMRLKPVVDPINKTSGAGSNPASRSPFLSHKGRGRGLGEGEGRQAHIAARALKTLKTPHYFSAHIRADPWFLYVWASYK